MRNKVYQGQRPADDDIGDCKVFVIEDGQPRPLYHVKLHSDNFEWGYGGSGPADTALSILADYLGEHPKTHKQIEQSRAWKMHQAFKWAFIAPAPRTGFTLTSEQIAAWLAQQEQPEDLLDDTP